MTSRIRAELEIPQPLELTRQDTLALKAVAILLIVAHNFLHQVMPTPAESEFGFVFTRGVVRMFSICITYPLEIPHALLAYFGHMGVSVFVLLSGYGLTRKLLDRSSQQTRVSVGYREIIAGQFRKMAHLIAIGAVMVVAYRFAVRGGAYDWVQDLKDLAAFLTMTSNLRSGAWGEFVTVWWFFGLIIQMYWLFPLLVWQSEKRGNAVLLGSFALLAVAGMCYSAPSISERYILFATPLAHLATFVLGIQLALGRKVHPQMVQLCAGILLLAVFSPVFFPAQGIAFVIVTVYAYQNKGRALSLMPSVQRIGRASAFIFLVHGFLREPWVEFINWLHLDSCFDRQTLNPLTTYSGLILWLAFVFAAAAAAKWIYQKTDLTQRKAD